MGKRVDRMWSERIASLRNRLGWSQSELARRLNISPSTVGMYEQGRREPSVEMLVCISRTLGVSIDFLVTGRITCQQDLKALTVLPGEEQGNRIDGDVFRFLSREELTVLLTACLWEH